MNSISQRWRRVTLMVASMVLVAMLGGGLLYSGKATSDSVAPPSGVVTTVAGVNGQDNDDDACQTGVATDVDLYLPVAVATFGNEIYFADEGDSCVYALSPSGAITPVAGTGESGYNGDNQLATSAELNDPQGLAFDAAGDLFIADSQNERIREVTPEGMISTVAGNGVDGFAGDNGPATGAELNLPLGIAVDGSGDLFIADTQNERVREVSTNGVISTIAGTGAIGYNGDDQPATQASLFTPSAIAVGPTGAVFVGDVGNSRVREIQSGTITTVAGDSSIGYDASESVATETPLYNPYGLAFDKSGDLFIADPTSCVIRELLPNGTLALVAGLSPTGPSNAPDTCHWNGDGLAGPKTALYRPYGVAIDASGDVVIADTFNEVVRELIPSSTTASSSVRTSTTSSSSPSDASTTTTTASNSATSTTTTIVPSSTTTSTIVPSSTSTTTTTTATAGGQSDPAMGVSSQAEDSS